ncbi:hypothetical protein AMJ39_06780 [candidate division TA06 bacterium DG_24]|uniref:Uncharacterized protein n=3 Tax=Bacteria division TA06 TaxID=1156500 RepID=A0A0S8GAX5_UNCT6|nr:MAG: hypothetical protein AMJ39_06780 [candidate division TA06 bacterium DG_24]KPK68989.1 MAG: hypothetical protein AMJ82_06795 [candidate division TA06 bacterium SM23_40]
MQDAVSQLHGIARLRVGTALAVAIAGLLVLLPMVERAQGGGVEYVPSEVLVVLEPGMSTETIDITFGTTTAEEIPVLGVARVTLPGYSSESEVIGQIRDFDGIIYTERNFLLEAPEADQSSMPFIENDPSLEDYEWQRAVDQIRLTEAHEVSTGEGIRVAILDTGADLDHWLLLGHLCTAGADLVDDDPDPSEEPDGIDNDWDGYVDEARGHGTHIAGIIALVAPDCEIAVYRVLNAEGRGTLFNLIQGIAKAVEEEARIINLSLGMQLTSPVLQEALAYARDAGCLIVCTAGNTVSPNPEYMPAASPHTYAVAATDTLDVKAPFSNYGDLVSLTAPGVDIYSAFSDDLCARWDGTSMAAPFISGTAALVWALAPGLAHDEVMDIVLDAAVDIDSLNASFAGQLGAGRLDAAQALSIP